MPSNYSGNPNNITTPLSAAIVSCISGAGGFVLVGTSGAHLFATYDYVSITGVLGTTEANTTAEITVTDSTHFLLDGVPFVNAYSSGGTAEDFSLTPYFQVPDDGEAGTVAGILASIKALADRTQWLKINAKLYTQTFTGAGTWTAPPGVTSAIVIASGGGAGGGGGGGGGGAADPQNYYNCGGGGGGGAVEAVRAVTVVPLTDYAISIGAGGAGGAAGVGGTIPSAGVVGTSGGSTTFGSLASFAGADGGGLGRPGDIVATFKLAAGGAAVRRQTETAGFNGSATQLFVAGFFASNAQCGGVGISQRLGNYGGEGGGSIGYFGGVSGALGVDSGNYRAGGPAGGGGAGAYGIGGAGGAGGNGSTGSPAAVGSAGGTASANTGGGGGGGGGGGMSSDGSGGANGGAGGTGGSGRLTVIWFA